MELTGNPFWRIEHKGAEQPKITTFLNEAQAFVQTHGIESITFYISMLVTGPGRGGLERDFGKREMSKEELLSLNQAWLENQMHETAKVAAKDFGFADEK